MKALPNLLFDEHDRVIGAGIVGVRAGDLIAEVAWLLKWVVMRKIFL